MNIALLDNRDSFAYNLVDALGPAKVYRNTVPAQAILDTRPDLIVLSPGPGHPADAGCMMELISLADAPILGVCLGFQALIHHHGGVVASCGAVHGVSQQISTRPHEIFTDLRQPLSVARYHSLGCRELPAGMRELASVDGIVMAAETDDGRALGVQFHPESILTPQGPQLLENMIKYLTKGASRV